MKTQTFNHPFYLTDGGLETSLIFQQGIELVHFAAFELLTHSKGRQVLQLYYQPYLELSLQYGFPFVLETPTWRSNTDWGYKLGYSARELDEINRKAIRFMRTLHATNSEIQGTVSGCIGPRGDGYAPGKTMTPDAARQYHLPQIRAFADEGADCVTAMTINYSDEAAGIVQAAADTHVPVVISFTVETDGRLPGGESLREAIEQTDRLTDGYTRHFMVNCAHPTHFLHLFTNPGNWKNRIQGIRANASTKSHAALDACETLDTGDKGLLASGYARLKELLPNLQVIGGCCGTDHSHMEAVCRQLFREASTP